MTRHEIRALTVDDLPASRELDNSPPVLRRAGLLAGGDQASDAFLAAASAGPPPALVDYF